MCTVASKMKFKAKERLTIVVPAAIVCSGIKKSDFFMSLMEYLLVKRNPCLLIAINLTKTIVYLLGVVPLN